MYAIRSYYDSRYIRRSDFLGRIEARDGDTALLSVRNRFFRGESLESVGPAMRASRFEVARLSTAEGAPLEVAQPNQSVRLGVPAGVEVGDLLRRRVEESTTT